MLTAWSLSANLVAWAQSGVWSQPLNLFETEGYAAGAVVVADPSGAVHVFWAYSEPGDEELGSTQSIYYVRKQDDVWSEPVDVLISPGNRGARMVAAVADLQGYLHVVWSGGDSIFYSRAYAPDAGNSQAWTPPRALDSGAVNLWPAIAVSDSGDLYVVWSRGGSGLMFVRSEDGGQNWSEPALIFTATDPNELAATGRIAVDAAGRLHVVFDHTLRDVETDSQNLRARNPYWMYYLRSDDRGKTWSVPYLMSPEPDFGDINVATFGEDTVHVVWNGRAGRNGRYHRWSKDGGATWSNTVEVLAPSPQNPLGTTGLTGFPALTTDATGNLHLVTTAGLGNYYFRWKDGAWSAPLLISPGLDGNGVTGTYNTLESPSIALGQGNQIHVAFHDGFERIWYTGTTIDAPVEQPIVLPSPIADPVPLGRETAPSIATATPTANPELSPAPVVPTYPGPTTSGSSSTSILLGVLPAVLLVGAVVVAYSRRRRQ